ncbi:MAG: isopenicillin N synthase family oxygenase [Burkholderiales bacterium]|nr:isopenicillin N synthase family oxygenase [Burkholderiales bacterium]
MSIFQVDFSKKNAQEKFINSIMTTGFAVIKNHNIDYKLIQGVYKEWNDFFTSEYKHKYFRNKETQDGYFPISTSETSTGYSAKDVYEFYHFLSWGQYPSELSDNTKILKNHMLELANSLIIWLEDNLPDKVRLKLSEPLSKMIDGSQRSILRIIHYPPILNARENGTARFSPHTDFNLLTILNSPSPGLQVEDKYGNWLDLPHDLNLMIVNLGDMIQEATGGFYKAAVHRVLNPVGLECSKSRLSIPLFVHPRPEVVLSNRYTAGEYFHERLIQLGRLSKDDKYNIKN